jgi:hypothetical protein
LEFELWFFLLGGGLSLLLFVAGTVVGYSSTYVDGAWSLRIRISFHDIVLAPEEALRFGCVN